VQHDFSLRKIIFLFKKVEVMPTSVSKKFRRHRSVLVKRNVRQDGTRTDAAGPINDTASWASGPRSVRFGTYDNQSTMHSVYELQECGPDDTLQSSASRSTRRMDPRNISFFQPAHSAHGMVSGDSYRQQQPIAEDGEYDEDVDDDRTRYAQQQRLSGQHTPVQNIIARADDDVIVVPSAAAAGKNRKASSSGSTTQLEATAHIQAGDVTVDRGDQAATIPSSTDESTENKQLEKPLLPQPPPPVDESAYRANLSEEENYFSEHC
jgi:hypothetical protein